MNPPNVLQIPANHNVTGTCGECGWPIISPMIWTGPNEWCMNCGRKPKPIDPNFGPIREMQQKTEESWIWIK